MAIVDQCRLGISMRPLVRLGKVARSLVVPVVAVPVGKFGLDLRQARQHYDALRIIGRLL